MNELQELLQARRRGMLPTPVAMGLGKVIQHYLECSVAFGRRPSTASRERSALKHVAAELSALRLDRIGPGEIRQYAATRLATAVSARTVNIELMALRQVLKHAVERQWMPLMPGFPPTLKHKAKRKRYCQVQVAFVTRLVELVVSCWRRMISSPNTIRLAMSSLPAFPASSSITSAIA
jgi:site-specific recombinase XerD